MTPEINLEKGDNKIEVKVEGTDYRDEYILYIK